MARFLADENMPGAAVRAARLAGHEISWVQEIAPGSKDGQVLDLAEAGHFILLTFDLDFGEFAFRERRPGIPGIILFRMRSTDPDSTARFIVATLGQSLSWEGYFSVAREGRLRQIPLPSR